MDTPKLKIILYRICLCVFIIWLLVVALWEYQIDNQFEAIAFPLIALFIVWQTINGWRKPNWGWVANLAFCIVFMCFNLRRTYNEHQNKLRLDKYGPVLNAKRAKLGIPLIPASWKPGGYYGDRDVEWSEKDSTIGHQNKLVFLDSLHRLEFEDDSYKLKRADSVNRYVNIRTYFSKSGSVDSTDYTYEAGFNNKTISRTQADSIFKTEKIQKDY